MLRKVSGIIYIFSFALFPWLVISPSISTLASIPLRLVVFSLLAVGGAFLFRQAWPRQGWGIALLITTLGYASAYQIASFFPDISPYPFSLGWSEGSRYYYASLWFSNNIYGLSVPPSVLHPTRYLLQSIPFLFSNSSLWFNRFWQVFLWVGTASLTSWLLVRRLTLSAQYKTLVITLILTFWGFIFLFQGPVYYHLLLMVILILWSYDSSRSWRTLSVLLIASLWAGISRVNWLPVPGLLVSALYLLEVKANGKHLLKYLLPPAFWVLAGTTIAYVSQRAYQLWSGNPQAWFGSSFTSDLLWYRLLPNPTYRPGILISIFLVSLPLVGLMALHLINHFREFHFIRLLGLTAILGVLFLGGIIVSVKIGGGSNLHNLDAYLVFLLVIGSYIFFDRFQPDKPAPLSGNNQYGLSQASNINFKLSQGVFIVAAVAMPVYFSISSGGQIPVRDYPAAQAALQTINTAAQQAVNHGGEVLFISQRQLLTFNYVPNVPLVPNDELEFLMEMAMSDNTAYLDAFHADISHQRFAMIVSEPLVIQYQGSKHNFGEENDAWVAQVSEPVLCYYAASIKLDSVGVVIYTPRPAPCK